MDIRRLEQGHKALRIGMAIGLGILFLLLLKNMFVHADYPTDSARSEKRQYVFPNYSIRLAAGDDGPFFSYKDLAAYTPVPKKQTLKWTVLPKIWKKYPPQIDEMYIVPRAYSTPTINYLAEHEVRSGDRQKQAMALTFDCETGPNNTYSILNTLEGQRVKATFFILGKFAYLYPDVIREIVAGEHELGNHSFFHPLFTALTPISMTQEILYTEAVIDWAAGQHVPMRYIRFPYGGRSRATRLHAAQLGYQSAFWDIDPRGWEPEKSSQDVILHVQRTAHPGGIIIMHCGSRNDAQALPAVIQAIRERGLAPGTLTDVLTEADYGVSAYPLARPDPE